tara:strand:- start:199 stop:465 length:267 start_codon:yes stop_codon:yes gene_type:complete
MNEIEKEEFIKNQKTSMAGCMGVMSALTFVLLGLFLAFKEDVAVGLPFVLIGGLIIVFLIWKGKRLTKKSTDQLKKDEKNVDDTLENF